MLTSWKLENFKSVSAQTELSLSPITILVGANSSGKSSIIQSILTIKQTMQYATPDRAIALNGPLLKLGNFDDVKNVFANDDTISIGWTYDAEQLRQLIPGASPPQGPLRYRAIHRSELDTTSCFVTFSVQRAQSLPEIALLQPHLKSCSISITTKSASAEKPYQGQLEIERSPDRIQAQTKRFSISDFNLAYNIRALDPVSESTALEDYPGGKIRGAAIRHFLPAYIGVEYDAALRQATLMAEAICNQRVGYRLRHDVGQSVIPTPVLEIIEQWHSEVLGEEAVTPLFTNGPDTSITLDMLIARLREIHRPRGLLARSAPLSSLQERQTEILQALQRSLPSETQTDIEFPRVASEVASFTSDFFETHVKYLGPLRDEPKPLYPLEALGNPTDVGYRGEHTAAVLDLNRNRQINYVPAVTFSGSLALGECLAKRTGAKCIDAVIDWLSYMGVVEDVATSDRGKIGHEMQVKTAGIEKYHDLTNVGVGVSQVLPIVVTSLLAQAGSVLIFEQPELHLHPKVQTRLADFFISMALCSKQCIIETHSEYLIHRLRRRIAEAPGEELTKISKIYFVEREAGSTKCRPIGITLIHPL